MNAAVESWMEKPMRQFIRESGAVFALVAHPSGQVMAQVGFDRAVDVMAACALAAAINASSAELGRLLDGKPFNGMHQASTGRQAYLESGQTARGKYLFLTVFDHESSLGLVRMFVEDFRVSFASAAPDEAPIEEPALDVNFEAELNRNLAALFGRAS
jgi:hypothetical protein